LTPHERARARILGYRPERRVVLEVERDGANWIEKGYQRGRAQRAALAHRRAAAALAGSVIAVAPLHEERPGTASVVFGVVEGARPRLDYEAAAALHQLGRGLRALQDAPLPLESTDDELPVFTAADELEVLRRWREKAQRIRHALPAGWDEQWPRCAEVMGEVPAVTLGLAHRDLHDGQLLVAGSAVTLLDFDLLCRAEVALDAANFAAHLHLRSFQRRLSPEGSRYGGAAVELLRGAFLNGLDRNHESEFRRRLACYEASSSLRLALVYFVRPRWESLAGPLIAHAERCLETCS
jgi:hypothetical protein